MGGGELGEKCPVSSGSRSALAAVAAKAGSSNDAKGCPVTGKGASVLQGLASIIPESSANKPKGPVYNVYSQEIDPNNMMPAPNQSPAPGQSEPLPIERVKSSIPKGGTEGTWLYPSPQMFYNSLVRKNKADGVEVQDVNMVVAIHNEMNERTWQLLKEWEDGHKS